MCGSETCDIQPYEKSLSEADAYFGLDGGASVSLNILASLPRFAQHSVHGLRRPPVAQGSPAERATYAFSLQPFGAGSTNRRAEQTPVQPGVIPATGS